MRPTKITMSAFGAYKDVCVLDMDKLGTQGIYLITGETGAGKTTVFDAIVYALYGTASGDARDSKMMRSKYASEAVPTYVDMEFEIRGEHYRVKRNPEYLRPKKSGEGFTRESAGVELYMPDGTLFNATATAVDKKLVEILRVDKNQFCKIAMLAQGDFQKFLLDNTERKTELLRKIFSTHIFEKIQQALKEDANEIESRCKALSDTLDKYFNDIQLPDNDLLFGEFEASVTVSEKTEVINKLIQKDTEAKSSIKKQLRELEKELDSVKASINNANDIEEKRTKRQQLLIQLEQKSRELSVLEEKQRAVKEKESHKNALIVRANEYLNALPEYRRAGKIKTEFENMSALLKKANERLEKSQKALRDNKEELKDYNNVEAEISDLLSKSELLGRAVDELEKYLDYNDDVQKFCDKLKAAQQEYSSADKAYNLASEAYFSEQAGFLAKGLEEGKPCCVCGSTVHPAPAALTKGAPDKAEVDRLKKLRDNAEANRNDISTKLVLAKSNRDTHREALTNLTKKEEHDRGDLKLYRDRQASFEKKLASLKDKKDRKERLEKEIPTAEREIEHLNQQAKELGENAAQLKGKLDSIKLELESEEKACAKAEELNSEAKKIENEINKAADDFNKAKNEQAQLKGQENAIAQELENASAQSIDINVLKDSKAVLESRKEKLNTEYECVSNRLSGNSKALEKIRTHSLEMRSAEEERSWKKSLSDTANGTVSNHKKIRLEAYVLSEYFRRILNRAGSRLMVMSDGQYELEIHTEPLNMQSQSGLDIDVIDHYNGTRRSVKTLSGGEKFMASLSIALGIADELQSSAGGIQLDTMFVDEGFGSLDSNALELAMRALSLIADSNRLVGIISHVEALNERIDKKIVVTKSADKGSSAHIEA